MALKIAVSVAAGMLLGVVLTSLIVWQLMPGMMIVTEPVTGTFDETVAKIETAIAANGWASPGTIDLRASINKHGQAFEHPVKVIQLCQPSYAASVLTTDRWVASLMPCTIAVWEADDGTVHISKMNTGLMGRLFGGNIAAVMGDKVPQDEAQILASVQ